MTNSNEWEYNKMAGELIFGFAPPDEENELPTFAVSIKEDFLRNNCLNDHYDNSIHRLFRVWEECQIYEVMESIFEYPEGAEDIVMNYLDIFNVQRNFEFEEFLQETLIDNE